MRTNQPPRRCASPRAGGDSSASATSPGDAARDAHRIASCSRNWRTFQTITGMTAMNSTTAMAAPRPSLLLMKNQLDHAFGDDLGAVRLGVAHDEDDVEHLQRVDDHVGRHDDDRREDARDHDPAEHLELGRAVDAGGLDDLVGDRLDGGRQHDHGEPGLHPDHDHHQEEVVPRVLLQPIDRVLAESDLDAVQQADVRAESLGPEAVDQPPRDRRAHEGDRHRQEDHRLRHRLAAAQPIGERREHEPDAHGDERDEHDPQRVFRIDRSMLSSVKTNL